MATVLTQVIIHDDFRVLLGFRKTGIGCCRWGGIGGNVKPTETIENGASRNLVEKCGVICDNLTKIGIIDFEYVEDPSTVFQFHIFSSVKFEGEPAETADVAPRWFPFDQVPFDAMWPSDKYWFEYLMDGQYFKGTVKYRAKNERDMLEWKIDVVDQFV